MCGRKTLTKTKICFLAGLSCIIYTLTTAALAYGEEMVGVCVEGEYVEMTQKEMFEVIASGTEWYHCEKPEEEEDQDDIRRFHPRNDTRGPINWWGNLTEPEDPNRVAQLEDEIVKLKSENAYLRELVIQLRESLQNIYWWLMHK